ncbi:hypothetical protein BH10BDE1_BH10BDE1_30780 [soil metagenome]
MDGDLKAWPDEVERTARYIQSVAKKPIWVCLSGGIDSELICHIFLTLKISFKVLTIDHANGSNRADTVWAKDWCKSNGVHQEIVTFDTDLFFSTYIPEKLKTGFYSPCPFRFFQLYLMETVERFDGFAVLGVGEQRFYFDEKTREAFLDLDTGLESVQKYAGDRHVPFFFYATPGIMLSYIESPQVRVTLEHPEILAHKENIFLLKRMVYQTYYPHLKTREKLDGWENVALEFAVARSRLQKFGAERTRYIRVNASQLESDLRGSKP